MINTITFRLIKLMNNNVQSAEITITANIIGNDTITNVVIIKNSVDFTAVCWNNVEHKHKEDEIYMTRQIQTMAHVTVSVFTMEENKIFEPVRMFLFFVWELFCCFKFITNFPSIFKIMLIFLLLAIYWISQIYLKKQNQFNLMLRFMWTWIIFCVW